MFDLHFWVAFFGAPLLLVLITAYVYRPSARQKYSAAKQIPFDRTKRVSRPGR